MNMRLPSWLKNAVTLLSGTPERSSASLPETVRLLFARRSCRSFKAGPLRAEDIHTILEAGRFAPSTVNLQTWSFITFEPAQWQAAFKRPLPFKGAYAVVVCADIFRLHKVLPDFQATPCVNLSLAIFNAGLAAMSMTLAAEALGIRSILLSDTGRAGLLDMAYLAEKLSLPEGVVPVATLVLGRGGLQVPGIPPRQPRDAVVMPARYDRTAAGRLGPWYEQMFIGYKLTHPLSSLDRQLAYYRGKMAQAEQDLQRAFSRPRGAQKKP